MKHWLRMLAALLALFVLTGTVFAGGRTETAAAGPVTVTVATYHAGNDNLDFAQTLVGQQILSEVGINVQVVGKPTDVAQAIITDMAAGTLPDVMSFWVADENAVFKTIIQGATQGQLAPLEAAIRRLSPTLTGALDYPERADEMRRHFLRPEFNGQWYVLPTHHSYYSSWVSGYGLFIRGDVADQLRITTPDYSIETPEQLLALLRRIRDAGIKDVNGNPAYPIGSFQWDGNLFGSITKAFDFGGAAFMGVRNGRVEPFITTDYAWQNVRFVRQLISEGLLDPEMFTDSSQRLQEKISQGRYAVWPIFASFAVTDATAYVRSLLSVAPQMAYRPLGNMLNHQGNRDSYHILQFSSGLGWAVSARANLDSAITLMDWINTREGRASLRFGVEGQHWQWNANGFPQMLPDAYAFATSDPTRFAQEVGGVTGGTALYLLSEATGLDSAYDVTGSGTDDVRFYQNDPTTLDKIIAARNATMPSQQFVNSPRLDSIFPSYSDWERFRPVWIQMKEVMLRAYLVGAEAEARRIIEDYRASLTNNGLANFLAHVQSVYDSNPAAYTTYATW